MKEYKVSNGVKASLAFFIASLISKGIGYLTTPIYTRILTTEEYGQTSVFLTWVQVFGILAMFCLSLGVFNNGLLDYKDNRDDYSFSMLILSNVITVIVMGIICISFPLTKGVIGLDIKYILLMGFIFLFQPAYNFWLSRQRFELKFKWPVFWAVLSAVISPLVAIICIYNNKGEGGNLSQRIFGAEIPLIIMYALFYIHLGKNNNFRINTQYWKSAFLFNLPLIPHYLSVYLLGSADKIMISRMISNTATAYYSVANSVASVAMIVWSAITSSLTPFVYENLKAKKYDKINRIVNPILFIFCGGCIAVTILAPEVVRVMATSEFMEGIYAIPPIIGGVFFQVQYYLFSMFIYYYKKPKYVAIGSLVSVTLNIVLNFIFIPIYGYIAAGYTTLVSYMVQAIIDYVALTKIAGNIIIDKKRILILSLFMIVFSLLSNITYKYLVLRIAIIVLLFGVLIAKRKEVFSVVSDIRR